MAENTVSAEIYEIAYAAAGADESEKKLLERLCAQAEERLKAALRAGVSVQDCEGAYVCASAWLAAAALDGARLGGEELSSLRAGELTVTRRTASEKNARLSRLRAQAWEMMRPYTTDGGFCFRGVQG